MVHVPGLVLAAFVAFAMVSLAPVAAQTPPPVTPLVLSVHVDASGDPVVPVTQTVVDEATVGVRCAAGAAPPSEPILVTLTAWASEEWADISVETGTLEVEIPPEACVQGISVDTTFRVVVSFVESAPAFGRGAFHMQATAEGAQPAIHDWSQTVGVLFNQSAKLQPSIVKGPPGGRIALALTIHNQGNDAIHGLVSVANESSSALVVTPPGPSFLLTEPFGAVRTGSVEVLLPESGLYEDNRQTLVLEVTFRSASDPVLWGNKTVRLSAVIQVQGSFLDSPGPPPTLVMLSVLTLLAMAAALRRR